MINKIWKDPVWSKVISVGIIGLIGLCYAKFLSITENLTLNEAFNKIIGLNVKIIYVLVILVLYWLVNFIIKLFRKEKSYYNKKQSKLIKFNNHIDEQQNIIFRWNVYFQINGNPSIADLEIFCTNHGEVPLKFLSNNCPNKNCSNSHLNIDKYYFTNYFESAVKHEWSKINND